MEIQPGQSGSLWCIRLALVSWFLFAMVLINGWRDSQRQGAPDWPVAWLRGLWWMATLFLFLHIVSAFAFYHDFSHRVAADHTGIRTEEFTGLYWRGGIWFNYLFLLGCIVEAWLWWRRPERILRRDRWTHAIVYGCFCFMIFNASVVFVVGPVRWISLLGFCIVGWQAMHVFLVARKPA